MSKQSKPYNIFISWSGIRSRSIAETLRKWLPLVIQSAKPFMSESDVEKGSRGLHEITKALAGIKVGISCLTPENLTAPWILYEAGALTKAVDDNTRLCTYLLGDLKKKDIGPPLGMFQHTYSTKDETRQLVSTLNSSGIGDDPIPEADLGTIFDKWWPDLETAIKNMPNPEQVVTATRPTDEILTEILQLCKKIDEGLYASGAGMSYQDSFPAQNPLGGAGTSYARQVKLRPALKTYQLILKGGEIRLVRGELFSLDKGIATIYIGGRVSSVIDNVENVVKG